MSTTMQPPGGVLVGEERAGLRGKLRRKLDELQAVGVGGVLRKAFHDHIYWTRDYVVFQYLPGSAALDPADFKDVMVIEASDPMPDFARHFGQAKAAECEATIRAGKLGFVVVKDDAVVAVTFCALQDHYEASDRYCSLVREGEAYFFGTLVPPGQRSFGVFSRLVKHAIAVVSARGCHRLYTTVEPWNLNSLGPLLFLGFEETGEIIHLHRLLWWAWSTRETYTEPRFARFMRKRAGR